MREVGSAIQGINVLAILTARTRQGSFFAENVVVRPGGVDTFNQQLFRGAVGNGNQVGVAFIFDGNISCKILHQQRAALARNFGSPWNELQIRRHESNVKEFCLIGN